MFYFNPIAYIIAREFAGFMKVFWEEIHDELEEMAR